MPGTEEFLQKYSRLYDLFVASGTPESELISIVRRRNLSKFFKQVFGSPKEKSQILKDIIANNNYVAEDTVFIGDSRNDYLAALEASMHFVGRVPSGNQSPFPEKGPLIVVQDLNELDRVWRERIEKR